MNKNIKIVIIAILIGCHLAILSIYGLAFYGLGELLTELRLHMNVYEQQRQEEILDLNTNLNDVIQLALENDISQIEATDYIWKNLTDLGIEQNSILKSLINITKEQKEITSKIKPIEKITTNVEKLREKQLDIQDKMKNLKTYDLVNRDKVKKANHIIYNATTGNGGSGTYIKLGKIDYILTCSHLSDNESDVMYALTDNNVICPMFLIKMDRKLDLALYEVAGMDGINYLQISDEFPTEGSEVIVVGNPAILQDAISDGIIMKEDKKGYLLTNKIFYGSSGGAVLYKGKIVGVVSHIGSFFYPPIIVNYGYSSNLVAIKEFLSDIIIIEEQNYVPGQVIICFSSDAFINGKLRDSIRVLNAKYGMIGMENIFDYIYKIVFPKDVNIFKIIKDYKANPYVIYAEPNYILTIYE